MCCTCGTAESDLDSCGRSSAYKVSPTTGKGAGLTDVDGLCGRSCSGVETVDSVGVYEFDTESESVVATHLLAEGIGGEPYASHDGSKSPNVQGKNSTAVLFGIFSPRQIYSEYIVLLGKNGGSTVRVLEVGYRSVVRCCYFLSVFLTYHLGSFIPHVQTRASLFAKPIHGKAGEPGLPSTLVADIELDFSRDSDRYDNLSVARDFAFVEILGKTYLAFPSGEAFEQKQHPTTSSRSACTYNFPRQRDFSYDRHR